MSKDRISSKDVRSHYDQKAGAFAAKAPTMLWWEAIGKPAYKRNLSHLQRNASRLLALDMGTASGRVPQFLRDEIGIPEKNITGVELSSEQLAIAKTRLPGATLICGDASKVKLPKRKFDVVTSNMVWEFMDDDTLLKTLKNARQALKPGGTLFSITTHPDKMAIDSGLDKPGRFEIAFPWGGRGPNYYRTVGDFREIFGEAGLIIQKIENLQVSPRFRPLDPEKFDAFQKYPYIRLAIKAQR